MLALSDLIIRPSESLRNALRRMTDNRCGVLFVCDGDAHVVGVLSDGDVRRALLEDTLLMSPVEKVMNTDPIIAATPELASDVVRKLTLVAVPVVDAEGRIRAAVIEDKGQLLVLHTADRHDRVESCSKSGVAAFIPARGGSKRIPKKNLALVGGKTLLARAIDAAKTAMCVTQVIVSTDDYEIAEAARAQGIDVPWLRPEHLALDHTPTLDVLVHAATWVIEHLDARPEFGVLLEPTAPLRTGAHIDDAIALLSNSDADCVASVSEVPHVLNPEELLVCENGLLRPYMGTQSMDTRRLRGKQTSAYVQNGLVYAFRMKSLLKHHSLYGQKTLPLFTPWEDFVDIDTMEDLQLANSRVELYAAVSTKDKICREQLK